jgi:uncharacterized protein (TIGR03437 family)
MAPATLAVSVDPSGLNPGSYQGAIKVSGTDDAGGQSIVFVTFDISATVPAVSNIVNSASYVGGQIAPGEMFTIFGTSLGPTPAVRMAMDANNRVATRLAGIQVLCNGIPAPLLYAAATQIAAIAPYGLAGSPVASIVVTANGQTSNTVTLPVVTTVPAIFTADSSGAGPGSIANPDSTANSAANPAAKGSIVMLYVTGEGQTIPQGITGQITSLLDAAPWVPQPVLRVSVTVDGRPAAVRFYGEAPGVVAGVMQLNIEIPADARSGDLPVVVSVGDGHSQTDAGGIGTVTVSVK